MIEIVHELYLALETNPISLTGQQEHLSKTILDIRSRLREALENEFSYEELVTLREELPGGRCE